MIAIHVLGLEGVGLEIMMMKCGCMISQSHMRILLPVLALGTDGLFKNVNPRRKWAELEK